MLSFGHIRPYKGIEDLVAAFKIARQTVPDLFLVVAGKAWNEQLKGELEQALSDTPNALLHLSYVASSQIKEFFFAADVVVLAYREFAAQSGPGNIALAFEKPLIVADVGGLPELVGCPEAVFEPGNVAALARALERCVGDPGMLVRMAADSARLRERFSWRRVARDTVAAYQELLDSRP